MDVACCVVVEAGWRIFYDGAAQDGWLAQGREKVKGFIGAHHDGKLSGPRLEFKQMDVER